jgi:FecR protein
LLLDQTNISVGTNSQVVLDRFVFDPDRPKGDVILTATRGVFRFVTGTQDHSSYHIKTPMATIGVRGTVVQFYIPEIPTDGSKPKDIFQLVLESGQADVTKLDGEVVPINETGILFTIHSDGSHDQRPWVGRISLYESHLGDVTGALGARGAGAGAGGQTSPTFQSPSNLGGGSGGKGNQPSGGPSGPINPFTFTGTKAAQFISP